MTTKYQKKDEFNPMVPFTWTDKLKFCQNDTLSKWAQIQSFLLCNDATTTLSAMFIISLVSIQRKPHNFRMTLRKIPRCRYRGLRKNQFSVGDFIGLSSKEIFFELKNLKLPCCSRVDLNRTVLVTLLYNRYLVILVTD